MFNVCVQCLFNPTSVVIIFFNQIILCNHDFVFLVFVKLQENYQLFHLILANVQHMLLINLMSAWTYLGHFTDNTNTIYAVRIVSCISSMCRKDY